jgi:hypothetical protein
MLNVTRDVVSDLWPIYEAHEATADTRALVDAFLAGDPEFAQALRASAGFTPPPIAVHPEAKLAALARTRALVRGNAWLRSLRMAAMVFTIFSLSRIVSDTSWDVSPRMFIIEAALATFCWTAYCVLLRWYRQRALRA